MSSISGAPTRNILRAQSDYLTQTKSSSDPVDTSTDIPPEPATKAGTLSDSGGPQRVVSPASQTRTSRSDQVRKTEWKLVYRTLRLISDWTLSGFFSEVCVVGAENIPKDGALILTPCHHNEIIDIATLSATIPHRRIIAYWTKGSLFKNPVSRYILESAGAIPVARTTESRTSGSSSSHQGEQASNAPLETKKRPSSNPGHQALFDVTYKELAYGGRGEGGVLAVFPEGTSYTMPRIVQVKEGAARVALGYIRWLKNCKKERLEEPGLTGADESTMPINIVPVGIVYTDKSHYRSRVYVGYGKPIDLKPFVKVGQSFETEEETQVAVRKITDEISDRMCSTTINAQNWDTLYAARTALDIHFATLDLPLANFLDISQSYVSACENFGEELKKPLLQYHALLYHTGLRHTDLLHVPHIPSEEIRRKPSSRNTPASSSRPILSYLSIFRLLMGLPFLVGPLIPSLPTHLAHIPAYVLGTSASRALAGDEEEARAQFKTIFGGFGRLVGTLATGWVLVRSATGRSLLQTTAKASVEILKNTAGLICQNLSKVLSESSRKPVMSAIDKCMTFAGTAITIVGQNWFRLRVFGDIVGILGIAYLLSAWHSCVIDSNYTRYRRAGASLSILRATILSLSRHADVRERDALKPYFVTPPPPINPYISKSLQSSPEGIDMNPKILTPDSTVKSRDIINANTSKVSKSLLIRHLLLARAEAIVSSEKLLKMVSG